MFTVSAFRVTAFLRLILKVQNRVSFNVLLLR